MELLNLAGLTQWGRQLAGPPGTWAGPGSGSSQALASKGFGKLLATWLLADVTSCRGRVQAEVTVCRMSQGALALGSSASPSCQEPGCVWGRESCAKGSLRASKPKKRQLSLWWN